MRFGSAWPRANIQLIDKTTEVAPGIHLIALVSDKPGTLELRELSLAMETPDGMVVVSAVRTRASKTLSRRLLRSARRSSSLPAACISSSPRIRRSMQSLPRCATPTRSHTLRRAIAPVNRLSLH